MAEPRAVVALSTVDAQPEAARLAALLVEARLAACVSVLPGVHSTFRWEGQVATEHEYLLLIKTVEDRLPALRERLTAEHPYDVPEFIVLSALEVSASYLGWLEACTRP
ncbi:MAG TPA: divalent-cation tolerance protein CutA [Candidatus Dormibacteraeota bacterium]|jgi:periplasmic divalent cation tolerance protein